MPTTRQSCLAELAITSFFAFRRAFELDETSSDYSSSYSTSYFRSSAVQDVSHWISSSGNWAQVSTGSFPGQLLVTTGVCDDRGWTEEAPRIWLASNTSDHLPRLRPTLHWTLAGPLLLLLSHSCRQGWPSTFDHRWRAFLFDCCSFFWFSQFQIRLRAESYFLFLYDSLRESRDRNMQGVQGGVWTSSL